MGNIIRIALYKMRELELFLINRKEKTHYGDELRIPFFKVSFCSDKTLVDSLKRLKSTPGPLVIETGEIMSCNDRCLSGKFPCYILVWSSDFEKGWISRGLGFYYGCGSVITAKHVIERHKNDNIYVLFPTHEYCLIYNVQKIIPENFPNHDIASIKLHGCLDPLQNMKLEIGQLFENRGLYFDVLESGCFVRKYCKIEIPNTNMKNQMSANEFVISEAGKEGGSGTPIFSSSGICVGLYIGVFTTKNSLNPAEYGRVLQFEKLLF